MATIRVFASRIPLDVSFGNDRGNRFVNDLRACVFALCAHEFRQFEAVDGRESGIVLYFGGECRLTSCGAVFHYDGVQSAACGVNSRREPRGTRPEYDYIVHIHLFPLRGAEEVHNLSLRAHIQYILKAPPSQYFVRRAAC